MKVDAAVGGNQPRGAEAAAGNEIPRYSEAAVGIDLPRCGDAVGEDCPICVDVVGKNVERRERSAQPAVTANVEVRGLWRRVLALDIVAARGRSRRPLRSGHALRSSCALRSGGTLNAWNSLPAGWPLL